MLKQVTQDGIIISIKDQTLLLYESGRLVQSYLVSTSANPPSCLENSYGTPLGYHSVAQKIGGHEPLGMVFKGRQATGQCYYDLPQEAQQADLITTRILWLQGEQAGINQGGKVDSYARYIYIHGTNHESMIGRTASQGCIRMLNEDVRQLFDRVDCTVSIFIS